MLAWHWFCCYALSFHRRPSEEDEVVEDMHGLLELLEVGSIESDSNADLVDQGATDTSLQPSQDAAAPDTLLLDNSSGGQERFKVQFCGVLRPWPGARQLDGSVPETVLPSGRG